MASSVINTSVIWCNDILKMT